MDARRLLLHVWTRSVATLLLPPPPPSPAPLPAEASSVVECHHANNGANRYSDYVEAFFNAYIADRYSETQRHYHTLKHIAAMEQELDVFLQFRAVHDKDVDTYISRSHKEDGSDSSRATGDEESHGAELPPLPSDTSQVRRFAKYVAPTTDALRQQLTVLPSRPPPPLSEDAVLRLVMDLAILFHDAVYKPTARDNEAQSVLLFRDFLRVAREANAKEGLLPPSRAGGSGKRPRQEDPSDQPSPPPPPPAPQQTLPSPLPSSPPPPNDFSPPLVAEADGLWRYPTLVDAVADEVERVILATTHHFAVPPMAHMTLPTSSPPPLAAAADKTDRHAHKGAGGETKVEAEHSCDVDSERVPTELLLLDLDLAILGSDEEVYNSYTTDIRAEYGHLSEADFFKGRGQFLASALGSSTEVTDGDSGTKPQRMQLYKTPFFFRRFEARAWVNMRRELEEVQARYHALTKGASEGEKDDKEKK